MGHCVNGLVIESTMVDIRSDCQQIPKSPGIQGGVVCTGFIDVEKILRRVKLKDDHAITTHFFLEKKLPFQVLFIAFDAAKGDLDDCSGSDHSSGSFESDSESESFDDSSYESSGE